MIKDYSYWIIPVYIDSNWDYEFLVIHQKTEKWSFWGFPKWHAEKGEDWLTAAIRELEEEVWINDINIDERKFWWFDYKFEERWIKYDKTVKYRLWSTKNKDVTIQQEELKWYKRVNYTDTLTILSHKNMKDIFTEITKNLFVIK